MTVTDLHLRPATAEDLPAVVALAGLALGWAPDDPNEAFFRWKHLENPYGPSPMWIAEAGGRPVGLRTMMRWRFRGPGGATVEAVRAVDTATHPEHRGRGIFRRLTLGAVDALTEAGVGFVFNTPNDASRPGYLSMGWHVAGRPAVRLTVRRSPTAVARVAASRTAAGKWSEPTDVGVDAATFFSDASGSSTTAGPDHPPTGGWTTDRTPDWWRWRFAFPQLAYRVVGDLDAGLVFRLRRRGRALELAVAETLGTPPPGLVRATLRRTGADHALGLTGVTGRPVRALGPVVTTRDLARPAPDLAQLDLSLADVELF